MQQFIVHVLPLTDQIVGAEILQIFARLGIPLGMSMTTVIWSSTKPSYTKTFIATMVFAGVALCISPFARLGKLGIASTPSLPSSSGYSGRLFRRSPASLTRTDSELKNLNHDGPAHVRGKRLSQLIQPRSSSLVGGKAWKRRSSKVRSSSFHLPEIPGPRISGSGIGLSDEIMSDGHRISQTQRHSSAAMTSRVIWLVCEECGSSKRIVEPLGDPNTYFYDASGVEDGVVTEMRNTEAPPSVYRNVKNAGAAVNKQRFSLIQGPFQPDT